MPTTLNVLYAADENYAPFLGVSMFSLFKHNTDIAHIRVYAVLDNVSDENKQKLLSTARQFNREFIPVDAAQFNTTLQELGVPTYRGRRAANYRIFFDKIIAPDVEKLLYLDCDTLIVGSVAALACQDLGPCAAAAVQDSLGSSFYKKNILGFQPEEFYFNSGVLVIDVKNWQQLHLTQDILHHTQHVRARYCNPDQDLLNLRLKGHVHMLGPQYNFQPVHRAYSDGAYARVYGFAHYYTPAQIDAARKHPVILHTYRFLGQFPWHKHNLHPDTPLFDFYLSQTLWKDSPKQETACNGFVFKIERLLYRLLPKTVFLRLFAAAQNRSFARQNKKLQQN